MLAFLIVRLISCRLGSVTAAHMHPEGDDKMCVCLRNHRSISTWASVSQRLHQHEVMTKTRVVYKANFTVRLRGNLSIYSVLVQKKKKHSLPSNSVFLLT